MNNMALTFLSLAALLVTCVFASPTPNIGTLVDASSPSSSLPFVIVETDSYYNLGVLLGRHFSKEFQDFANGYDDLHSKFLPFLDTYDGQVFLSRLGYDAMKFYPDFFDEVRGLADGSGVSVEWVLIIQFRQELGLYLSRNQTASSEDRECTDVLFNSGGTIINGHNEDMRTQWGPGCYLVHAKVSNSTFSDDFLSFNYPLHIAGNAFCVNSKGLGVTLNAVFPVDVISLALGRQFLGRAMLLNAYDLTSAIEILKGYPSATGFSVNVGSYVTRELANIEVSPGVGNLVVTHANATASPYSTVHMNEYLHSTTTQHKDASSEARLAAAERYLPVKGIQEVRGILGDTQNVQYPIYRNGVAPDNDITRATAVFHYSENPPYLEVFTKNPSSDSSPDYKISLADFQVMPN